MWRSLVFFLCFVGVSLSAWAQDPSLLGVYATHSTTAQCYKFEGSWSKAVDRRLDSIASTHVRCVWWSSLPDDAPLLQLYFSGHRIRGMKAVAGSGAWYITAANYQTPNIVDIQFSNLKNIYDTLPEADRPWMWSLGDEPTPAALPKLRELALRCQAAGIPVTLTNVPEFSTETTNVVGTSVGSQCMDFYPFFVPGLSSNPPYGQAALTMAFSHQLGHVQRTSPLGIRPQSMTQGYGDKVLYAVPTTAQTEWQVWSSLIAGNRDVFVFIHGMPSDDGVVPPAPSLVDWNKPTETLTPQGQAVARVFQRLNPHASTMGTWTLESRPVFAMAAAGDRAAIYKNGSKRYLIAVADPEKPQRTLFVTLPFWSCSSIAGGPNGFNWFGNFWVTLPPGSGNIWELR